MLYLEESSENNVPDCCDTTVEDASSIEDGEGVSGVFLSIARVVSTTKVVKWLCCKLLTKIVDDDNSKEDIEVTADVPSVIRFELIVATDDEHFWIERSQEQLMLIQELMTSPAQMRPTLRGL